MPDYKQTYLDLLDGVEKAINLLIDTQKACEDIYVDTDETKESAAARLESYGKNQGKEISMSSQ